VRTKILGLSILRGCTLSRSRAPLWPVKKPNAERGVV
jgi:hypothetical protein